MLPHNHRIMKRYLIITVSMLLGLAHTWAQDTDQYNWKTNLKIANDLYARNSYYNAITYYEAALKVKPDNLEALYKNAHSHYLVRDVAGAEQWFKKLTDQDGSKYPVAWFYYGQTLKMNGKCEDAETAYNQYEASKGAEDKIKQQIQIERAGCGLQRSMRTDADVKVKHVGGSVNGVYPDFAPYPTSANEFIYTTIVTDTAIVLTDTTNYYSEAALSRLYKVSVNGDTWGTPEKLPAVLNGNMHSANGTFSPKGDLFFFTQCVTNEELQNICNIYVSRYANGIWEQPIKLSPQVNKSESNNTQPTVLVDAGGQLHLLFASDREGGRGGMDLWASKFTDDLSFGSPVNMSDLNTAWDEVTPFFEATSGLLYFSSNGYPTLGGLDVFVSRMDNGAWTKPANMGKPVNSNFDDLYFSLYKDQRTGYLASNRSGSISLLSETTSEDIYQVNITKKVDYFGFSYELGDSNLTPLTGVTYKLYKKNKDLGLYEELKDFKPLLDKDGKFDIPLKAGEDYKITASKDKYLSDTKYISNDDILKAAVQEKLYFKLDKISKDKTYTLSDIYYDYNKANLRQDSKLILDTLYMLLQENPKIVIELSSHTDSRGSDKYNLDLSQSRAESCVNYLISKGIQAERLQAKGYGEEKLLNKCDDGVKCTDEEHQINRRTEFRVVGELEEGIHVK